MNLKQKFKDNLLVIIMSAVVLLGSVITAGERTFGIIDAAVVTENELAAHEKVPHQAAVDLIQESGVKSECRWLRSEMRSVKDKIRDLRRSDADPEWIGEKEQELSELEGQWKVRKCTQVKYI